MAELIGQACSSQDMEHMHQLYRKEGEEKGRAPHIVYTDPFCPHGCGQQLQAIDFCLEAHGPAVHDPLVQAWWQDVGFAGRCPQCSSWIHFTIRGKRPITDEEADGLPHLPDDWHTKAIIL
jgi:hypothetical protein